VKQVFTGVPKRERDRYIEDGYWLYKGKDETIYIVNDKKKTITPLSLEGLQQLGSVAGGIVKIQILDHKAETQWLKNERILGLPCRHLKIISDYTLKIKIALIKKTVIVHQEREIWASTAVRGMKGIAQPFLRKEFKTGFPELDKMIEAETQRMKTMGVPLKSVTHTVNKNKKGKVTGDTTTEMEVTSIKSKKLDATMFELPLDYKTEEGV
jgi:hypothetical protein